MPDPTQSPDGALLHFGKYVLDRELARGGMARVFRARLRGPLGFEKKLVVKQILPELAADPSFVELFVKEANTLVAMSHPNLVPVYELGVVDGVYFLAMEWIEGATVSELLREGPLSPALVAQLGVQVAEALDYAHERFGIVHRDVTPRNVIVDVAGHVRLLDFGIAAKVEHTGRGELFGSPGYMSPEQLRGEPLSAASNLFALGALLYEAASGKPAFPGERERRARLGETLPKPLLEPIEASIDALLAELLQDDPNARPKSAHEVSSTLRAFLTEARAHNPSAELATRARRAHAERKDQPTPSVHEDEVRVSSGRIEVRSIATSAALDALLKEATLRMERAPSAKETNAKSAADTGTSTSTNAPTVAPPDPELQRTIKRFSRDGVIIMTALFAALWWAEQNPRDESSPDNTAEAPTAPLSANESGKAAIPPASVGATLTPTSTSTPPAPSTPLAKPSVATNETVPEGSPDEGSPNEGSPDEGSFDEGSPNESEKPGYLTVSATPWAEVRLDGRLLGTTPRRKVSVRPGKHTLSLDCPPLGRHARVPIEVTSGQSVQILVDLQEDPAKISLR